MAYPPLLPSDLDVRQRVTAIVWHVAGDHPASDGAHRLGWWIAESACPITAARAIAQAAGVTDTFIERITEGSCEPNDEMAAMIAHATAGAVLPGDWQRGGPLSWTNRPVERAAA